MKLLGIDDAGRGPVLGPMVLAGLIIDKEQEQELKDLDVKDSKLITPDKRFKIGKILKEKYTNKIVTSSPSEIDNHFNLNKLEAEKTAEIINNLVKEKTSVVVDCPSTNPTEWQDYVVSKINPEILELISLSCEHKADFNHPVVSAASIIAKEKREDEVRTIKKEFPGIGSGYPSDPNTKEFLRKNFNNKKAKDIIRHSWKTVKKLKEQEGQNKLF